MLSVDLCGLLFGTPNQDDAYPDWTFTPRQELNHVYINSQIASETVLKAPVPYVIGWVITAESNPSERSYGNLQIVIPTGATYRLCNTCSPRNSVIQRWSELRASGVEAPIGGGGGGTVLPSGTSANSALCWNGSSWTTGQSYVATGQTGSFVTTSQTGVFALSANTGSFVTTSQTGNFITTSQTGAFGSAGGGGSAVADGFGYNQVWQNFTASRLFNTTYTNNTCRPIMVSVDLCGFMYYGDAFGYTNPVDPECNLAYVNGVVSTNSVLASYDTYSSPNYEFAGQTVYTSFNNLQIVVPTGATYRLCNTSSPRCSTIQRWSELRASGVEAPIGGGGGSSIDICPSMPYSYQLASSGSQISGRLGSAGAEYSVIMGGDCNSISGSGFSYQDYANSFGASGITSLAYGSGLYLAASTGGRLATSVDGASWTQQTSSFGTTGIRSVIYGSGLYVAAGDSGKLATSSNGTAWTQQTSSFLTTGISGAAYGSNCYVIVGASGKLANSPNASVWTSRNINWGATGISTIAFGNNCYVIAGQSGKLATSTDANTWTERTSSFGTTGIHCVIYGNSLFVAAGISGTLATSPNGTGWTQRTSSFGTTGICTLAYGNGLYYAGGTGGRFAYSLDACTWNQETDFIAKFGNNVPVCSIVYGDKLIIGGGLTGEFVSGFAANYSVNLIQNSETSKLVKTCNSTILNSVNSHLTCVCNSAIIGGSGITGTCSNTTYLSNVCATGTIFGALDQAIGYNQTWQSVSRALNTTYTNTTNKPIMVSIQPARNSSSTSDHCVLTMFVYLYVNGVFVQTATSDTLSLPVAQYASPQNALFTYTFIQAIVPIGATYRLCSLSLQQYSQEWNCISSWSELR